MSDGAAIHSAGRWPWSAELPLRFTTSDGSSSRSAAQRGQGAGQHGAGLVAGFADDAFIFRTTDAGETATRSRANPSLLGMT